MSLYDFNPPSDEEPAPEEFQATPWQRILEGFQGIDAPRPRNFLEGLISGGSQGLAAGGQRVAGARKAFEQRQAERAKAIDAQRLRAGEARAKQAEYERDNPRLTPEQLQSAPWLARVTDSEGRVPRSVLGTAFAPKPERERRLTPAEIEAESYARTKGGNRADLAFPKPSEAKVKPSTGEQKQALAFYNRGKEALGILGAADKAGKTLEDRIAETNPLASGFGQRAPNWLKGSDRQRYEQAQRAFTQAKLRKESGAAISTAEYESDAQTYFAQPGDSPEVVANKKTARDGILEGLKFQSGPAYQEFYGESSPARSALPPGSAAARSRPPLESFMRP